MTANQMARLKEVFDSNRWMIEEDENHEVFNRFCSMLDFLDDDEKDLMLELTTRYIRILPRSYEGSMFALLNKFHELNSYVDNVYILPMLTKKSESQTKSCRVVHYKFKGLKFELQKKDGVSYTCKDTFSGLQNIKGNWHIILVDDYIGTSETAYDSIQYLKQCLPEVRNNQISLFAIIVQNNGLTKLTGDGFKVYYTQVVNRGISDHYDVTELPRKLCIMKRIENKLTQLRPDFRFGFRGSEALVSLERTPNNTFPVYWIKGQMYKAPFPR